MFINISNHPSQTWSSEQLNAAKRLGGDIIDIPFPSISSQADYEEVLSSAEALANGLISQYNPKNDVMHVMGEMCFSFSLIGLLQQAGFICVASTSDRLVTECMPNHKEVIFRFTRFRRYVNHLGR